MNDASIRYWKPILEVIDPWRELGPEDVKSLYIDRPDRPWQPLSNRLQVESRPDGVKAVLCGARGSGKSTELIRLARELSDRFCVVLVGLDSGLPDKAGTLGIIALIGAAALRARREWSTPDAAFEDEKSLGFTDALKAFGILVDNLGNLIDSVAPVVTLFDPTTGSVLKGIGLGTKAGTSLLGQAARIRAAFSRSRLTEPVGNDNMDSARCLVESVNRIFEDLAGLSGRMPLLLADGLDKRKDLSEVQQALRDADLLRDLSVPLVLTGPTTLRHHPIFRTTPGNFRLELLNNISVRRRVDGKIEDNPEGLDVLETLFQRRREFAGLPQDLIADELVREAARNSAGIIREFLELLSWASEAAMDRESRIIEAQDVRWAVRKRRISLQGFLDEASLAILQRVRDKGTLPAQGDTLLFQNIVVCYANGDLWFRPHEAIVDWLERMFETEEQPD